MSKTSAYTARIPDKKGFVAYTKEENAIWRDLALRQQENVAKHMVTPWREGMETLGLIRDHIPQIPEISEKLYQKTGWRLAAVPAVIGFKKFFEMLSEKIFPAATFIRTREDFDYVEEPDIFHEIFGHAPLLTHPAFAHFSQLIGKAGLRCKKEERSWLIRLFWFSIEFGLMEENGEIKALGAGLASSHQELGWSVSETPEHHPFNLLEIMRTPYRIDMPQPLYFVLDKPETLFKAAERNLLEDVAKARELGLHPPKFPPKKVEENVPC